MRKPHLVFILGGVLILNVVAWLLTARYLKGQINDGFRGPYVSLVKDMTPFDPMPPELSSRFVLADWVFPKDVPIIGPNGESSMSVTTDGHKVSLSVRKGTVNYHTPFSFQQVCDLYRKRSGVDEVRDFPDAIGNDSNQHAVFVCYGKRFNIFLIVTRIPASPNTSVMIAYRAVDSADQKNR